MEWTWVIELRIEGFLSHLLLGVLPLNLKDKHGAEAPRTEVLLRLLVGRVRGEGSVEDGPCLDVLVTVQPGGHGVGVLRVGLSTEGQSLEALNELEAVEGRNTASHVPKSLHATRKGV